jgi:DNA-binding transcriptional ArsR family regulator
LAAASCTTAISALTYNQMVVDTPSRSQLTDAQVDRLFRALADATRRDIISRTLVGEATVSQLAAGYDMSFAAVQKHVAVLEGVGLVTKEAHGRERIVRANAETIQRAQRLLEQFEQLWRSRIARLDALLSEDVS